MKISLIQMKVLKTPEENLKKIESLVQEAVKQGGELIVLPEMCCCEYSNSSFAEYAMEENSAFLTGLACVAEKNGIVLVAGTVPERDGEKIYNTSYVFDETGNMIAKHRKVHLFDINVKNGISFKESSVLSSGERFTSFDTKWGRIGLIICFDIRFPEFIKIHSDELKMIIVPASFNMITGPSHWELLFRARAVDNQVFMAGCASALDESAGYHSYGHSIITNPWSGIVAQLGTEEGIITCELDLKEVENVREQIPLYD